MNYCRRLMRYVMCFAVLSANGQKKYLTDIIATEKDLQYKDGYTSVAFEYWRFDTCLFSNSICRYTTSTSARVKAYDSLDRSIYNFRNSSQLWYNGGFADNTFKYIFFRQSNRPSFCVRTLILEKKSGDKFVTYSRTDTFRLKISDSLVFDNYKLIQNIFGEKEKQKSLKIYVLKNIESPSSAMLHFWVERIGILKLSDSDCWRYSFEITDRRSKKIEKLLSELSKTVKRKYKDPHWTGDACDFQR